MSIACTLTRREYIKIWRSQICPSHPSSHCNSLTQMYLYLYYRSYILWYPLIGLADFRNAQHAPQVLPWGIQPFTGDLKESKVRKTEWKETSCWNSSHRISSHTYFVKIKWQWMTKPSNLLWKLQLVKSYSQREFVTFSGSVKTCKTLVKC